MNEFKRLFGLNLVHTQTMSPDNNFTQLQLGIKHNRRDNNQADYKIHQYQALLINRA